MRFAKLKQCDVTCKRERALAEQASPPAQPSREGEMIVCLFFLFACWGCSMLLPMKIGVAGDLHVGLQLWGCRDVGRAGTCTALHCTLSASME